VRKKRMERFKGAKRERKKYGKIWRERKLKVHKKIQRERK
jgi:hypothetical protein